jgi:3-hydroxyisobutyrate dehydrogenase-like beta-hydroxyacid dehydrogenase
MTRATLIGNGEAGQAFDVAGNWPAYDIVPARSKAGSLAEALAGAEVVLSVVTADQALAAARAAAGHLARGALFCDMNSVAPGTKRAAAQMIEAAGGRYADVAVMSPVHPGRLGTPLLVAGAQLDVSLAALRKIGFSDVRAAGGDVGAAATIKMLRSVMYKGLEALTAECLIAAEKAGLRSEVLAMLEADWSGRAGYRLDRMMVHGTRRAAEMEEAAKTLAGLGVDPLMTRGTISRQRETGDLGISHPPATLTEMLEILAR